MKQNDIIFLLVSSAILTVAWVSFSIFHNLQTSTITDTLNAQILPIAPHFDTGVLKTIKDRRQLPPLSLLETSIATTESTVISPTETPTRQSLSATPSGAEINASNSGDTLP